MSNKKILVILAILFTISLVLITWQKLGMNYRYIVTLDKNIGIFDDRINGGLSESRITYINKRPHLKVTIKKSSTFPFSSMTVPLAINENPYMDLSKFDQMILHMDYQSVWFDTVLIYFINVERKDQNQIERSNMITIIPENGLHVYTVDLENIYTPSWWLYQKRGHSSAKTDISNVIRLQIATGDNSNPRDVEFTVKHIEFRGKWIRSRTLYLYIVIMWLLVIFLVLIIGLFKLFKQYKIDREKSRTLEHINNYLIEEKSRYENMAQRDPLTGCLNRYGLQSIISDFMSLKFDGNDSVFIIMFDLDHFKSINDQYGHDEGDEVLKNVARIVRTSIRESDYLIRWGGEEFLVICSSTTEDSAVSLAEKLCLIIENGEISTQTKVTASFGVSSLNINEFDESFTRVDQYLLKAKNSGRNRVVSE